MFKMELQNMATIITTFFLKVTNKDKSVHAAMSKHDIEDWHGSLWNWNVDLTNERWEV